MTIALTLVFYVVYVFVGITVLTGYVRWMDLAYPHKPWLVWVGAPVLAVFLAVLEDYFFDGQWLDPPLSAVIMVTVVFTMRSHDRRQTEHRKDPRTPEERIETLRV